MHIRLIVLAATLLGPALAHAQYENRSFSVGVGYMRLDAQQEPIKWGIPIQFGSSFYLGDGWDFQFKLPLIILSDEIAKKQILGTGAHAGVRYFLSEDTVRPYIGAGLSGLYIFRDETPGVGAGAGAGAATGGTTGQSSKFFFGVGATAGFDYFIGDDVSVGPRAYYDLYFELNDPVRHSIGGSLEFGFHY